MDETTLIQRQLSLTERQIAEAEEHTRRQRGIVARLDAIGRGGSRTAETARELLREMERRLALSLAERKRLRIRLNGGPDGPFSSPGATPPRDQVGGTGVA